MSYRGLLLVRSSNLALRPSCFPPVTQSPPVEAMVPTRRLIRGFDPILDDPEVGLEEPAGPPPGGVRVVKGRFGSLRHVIV